MEEVIRMDSFKRVEVAYSNGRTTLGYLEGSSRLHFTDFRGNEHCKDICWSDVKELNELLIAEGKVGTGDPAEITHNDGTTLAYFIEDLGSALAFNLPESNGYMNRQAKNSGYITELNKLVKAPIAIKL